MGWELLKEIGITGTQYSIIVLALYLLFLVAKKVVGYVELWVLEKSRSTHAKDEFEHQKVYESREKVIAELYRRLARTHEAFNQFVSIFHAAGPPSPEERARRADRSYRKFGQYFEQNRIYLENDLCEKIDTFLKELSLIWDDMQPHIYEKRDRWVEVGITRTVVLDMTEKIPPIRRDIERRFRKIFGIEDLSSDEATPEKPEAGQSA